jgi:hypothetical protein
MGQIDLLLAPLSQKLFDLISSLAKEVGWGCVEVQKE